MSGQRRSAVASLMLARAGRSLRWHACQCGPCDQGMIVAKDSESDEKGAWSASRWVLSSA